MPELGHLFDLGLHPQAATFVTQVLMRLLLAAFLGGAIGLERALHRRPAGLRTNLCICFGAAMFTILSVALAGTPADSARIAAQIIPGIGFIGAGSILHSRGSVTGLTTAATIFVVASIGMACGGGHMLVAIVATVLILLVLEVLGRMEKRWIPQPVCWTYQFETATPQPVLARINGLLGREDLSMRSLQMEYHGELAEFAFTLEADARQHERFRQQLQAEDFIHQLRSFSVTEQE